MSDPQYVPSSTTPSSRRTHGRRAADTIREHLPHLTDAELRQHLSDLDSFAEEEQSGVTAFPGAGDLLRSIPSHRWTIVTSVSEKMMRSRLASAGIVSPKSIVGGDSVTRGKPDPEGYLRGAALLTRSPHECLVVEDAPAGIRAGRSAGSQVLAVASSHDIEELGQADWIVASLDQIQLSIGDSATPTQHSKCVSRRSLPCTDRAQKIIAARHVWLLPPMPKNKNKQQNAALQRKKVLTHHPQMGTVCKRKGLICLHM